MNIIDAFGQRRVLLPVVHPVSERKARESIQAVVDAGCKGVFLINQGMSSDQVLALALDVRREHPALWIGINLLGSRPIDTLRRGLVALDGRLDGIWVDNAGVDRAPDALGDADAFVAARRELAWSGLYFGGVAFKYQPEVSADRLPTVCATAARYMDVVTTSGPGTGQPADLAKVRAMRSALGDAPMALASGVDATNIADYLPYVDAYLVGTSLETELGVLDPARVRELQGRVTQSIG